MTRPADGPDPRMPITAVNRWAALLVGLEGLALVALAAWQVVVLLSGDVDSTESGIALIVLTLAGAAIVLAFAAAVLAGRSWGRSGGIVTQVLIAAIALGAATGAYAHPLVGLALAVPAVVTFVVLVVAIRRAAPPKDDTRS